VVGEWPHRIDIAQAMTVIEYKGYRIEVSLVGKGWRALIFASGSARALADSPSNLEKSRTEEIEHDQRVTAQDSRKQNLITAALADFKPFTRKLSGKGLSVAPQILSRRQAAL
jgi:hypothetical protein